MKKTVCVFGLGYIGLPTAALLAQNNYRVLGVDIKEEVVNTINRGEIHIVEPGLEYVVKETVSSGMLRASLVPENADVFIIAVPTPLKEDYVPNIDYVLSASRSIAHVVKAGDLIIIESTSPVGTTDSVAKLLKATGVDLSGVSLAYCPERVLPGQVIKEFVENDRVIGGIDARSSSEAAEFYRTFVSGEIIISDSRTAEMVKLTENSFRDVNIAFANELSMICDKVGVDVWKLISLSNHHPRVNILKPATGVGGHCIAVDPWFLAHAGGDDAKMVRSAREVNDSKPLWVVTRIQREINLYKEQTGREPIIACLGLSFKPDIDDMRGSPALEVFNKLVLNGLAPLAVEPNLKSHFSISLLDHEEAVKLADIVIVLVSHKEFRGLHAKHPRVLDFCGSQQESV